MSESTASEIRLAGQVRQLRARLAGPGGDSVETRAALALALLRLGGHQARTGARVAALTAAREAAALTLDLAKSTVDYPARTREWLSLLSHSLQIEYEVTRELDVLDRAISTLNQVLGMLEPDDRDLSGHLSNLGNALRQRHEHTFDERDLQHAVRRQRQALRCAPDDDRDRSALLANLGASLRLHYERTGDLDSLDEAIAVLRQATAATSPEHPGRLRRLSNLGAALRARHSRLADPADLTEAEAILRRATAGMLPDSDDALAVLSNLANVLQDEADALRDSAKLAEAAEVFRQVADRRCVLLGPEHPDTLATRNNLANILAQQGELAAAEETYTALLADLPRVLGADHPDTLASRNNLANVLAQQGKLAEAEAAYTALLTDQLRVLGADHPDTLDCRNNLATALTQQGKLVLAQQTYQEVLAAQLRVRGEDHPDTQRTKALLSGLADMLCSRVSVVVPRVMLVVHTNSTADSADQARITLRRRMYEALKNAVTRSHIPWADCATESYGEGVLLLLSPQVSREQLVAMVPDNLSRELRAVNANLLPIDQLRLRVAMHAGPVRVDDRGVTSPAVRETFGMADAPALHESLRRDRADLALIISDALYQSTTRTPGALFRPARVPVRNADLLAWILHRPRELTVGQPHPGYRPSTVDPYVLVLATDALLAVPLCRFPYSRQRLLDSLDPAISSSVHRDSRARQEVQNILRTCLAHEDGLSQLLAAVRQLEHTTLPVRHLTTTLARLFADRGKPGPRPN
ncbi:MULTISPECIES: tetratricopeptide repeat protein [unclassified Crossiella]|uniref:tetratricopeptide repeat protein n=1 Tax=unclassified Crossiella TaxID=2620835 RepID=UPI001FFE7660|nr:MULTISPECIES: tetratricopeptide repeat protein [unclassified Crossiella]MCK2241592.1 tetratricopeptide repeat protein [Crossiella sp. S99.2]MCK2255536.1 tetratricopeptide repeat protein [Crossiella sp. S99.1]